MPALNHLHTYKRSKRTNGSYGGVYKCIDPNCSHFVSHAYLEGKKARCKSCGEEFIIEARFHFQRAEMKCIKCSKSRRSKTAKIAESIIADIFNPLATGDALESESTVLKEPSEEPKQLEFEEEDNLELDLEEKEIA